MAARFESLAAIIKYPGFFRTCKLLELVNNRTIKHTDYLPTINFAVWLLLLVLIFNRYRPGAILPV